MNEGGSRQSSGCCSGLCDCVSDSSQEKAHTIIRITNFLNAALVIFVGVFTLVNAADILTLHISAIAISVYLIIFGCMLCCYETRLKFIEKSVRQRFGFMYTSVGRAIFLVFTASLCIVRNGIAALVIGAATIANALLNFFVMWKFNTYFDDPTQNYSSAESNAAQFVQNNPQLASAAFSNAATYAANNPNVIQSGFNYAQDNQNHQSKSAY